MSQTGKIQRQESIQAEIEPEKINQHLEMIVGSKHFRQAKSLEKFLRYVVAKKLAGEDCELKEYTIGLEVFHRGQEFDPRTDAVVRVQAAQLRKKLASFYQEEGAASELQIELPKGSYVPAFQVCQSASSEMTSSEVALVEVAVGRSAKLIPALPARRIAWPVWGTVAIAFAIGILATMTFQQMQTRFATTPDAAPAKSSRRLDPDYQPLWGRFFEPGVSTVLAYGTPQFFVSDGLFLRDVRVNSPLDVETSVGARLQTFQKTFNRILNPVEVYTGVGEAHGIHTLSQFFWQQSRELRVARNRLVGWQEVKNSNLIFLSSMRFHTLADELNYPNDFAVSPDGFNGKVINRRPQPGEEQIYDSQDSAAPNYAVVTLWPGKAEHRRILMLSGCNTWATLAAAEYVTQPEHLRELNAQLRRCPNAKDNAHPPYFQVLVRAEVKDNQPISIRYITHHDLTVPDSASTRSEQIASVNNP